MSLILEREATWSWEIVGVFPSHESIGIWVKDNYGITFEEYQEEYPEATREDWYEENKLQVREIPTKVEVKKDGSFNLILCDFSEELCNEWRLAFSNFPEVEIRHGIFEHIDFDCINSPANSFGLMDGGIDEAITMFFGKQMMDRVQNMVIDKYGGEQPVGTSEIVRATPDGADRVRFVSHTPTMIIPELIGNTNNVYVAMRAMLLAVERHNLSDDPDKIRTLVCSGLGTGAGRVPFKQAATDMAKAYQTFKVRPKKITWPFATIRYQYIKGKNV